MKGLAFESLWFGICLNTLEYIKLFTELCGSLGISYITVLNMNFVFVSIMFDCSLSSNVDLIFQAYIFTYLVYTPGFTGSKEAGRTQQ